MEMTAQVYLQLLIQHALQANTQRVPKGFVKTALLVMNAKQDLQWHVLQESTTFKDLKPLASHAL